MPTDDQDIIFPPTLKPNGTIGIVSPARWPEPEWINKTVEMLEGKDYQTVVHAQNYLQQGRLAGSHAARAEALMDMFSDTTIDAIFCARGGTGAIHLLDQLDYNVIREHPKPFVGFSDMTVLLQAITKKCGFVTYHGPMGWNFATFDDPRSLSDLFHVLTSSGEEYIKMSYPEVEVLRPGSANGRLIGGNITLLQHLLGTPYDWSGKDAILFIEDVEEHLYALARKLKHMQLAGKFEGVRAVLVGEMVDINDGVKDNDLPYGQSLRDVLLDVLPENIPLCFNFPCGHGAYTTTLPIGALTHVILNAQGASLAFYPPED
jgi:muramoyltetrapeptide carboxypeptidase